MCKTVLERATRIALVFTTEKAIVLQLNYAHIAGENQKNPANSVYYQRYKTRKEKANRATKLHWSGQPESNWRQQLGRLWFYH